MASPGVLGKSPVSWRGEWFLGVGRRVESAWGSWAEGLLKEPFAVRAADTLFADPGRCLGAKGGDGHCIPRPRRFHLLGQRVARNLAVQRANLPSLAGYSPSDSGCRVSPDFYTWVVTRCIGWKSRAAICFQENAVSRISYAAQIFRQFCVCINLKI